MPPTETQGVDRETEIQALNAFLQADPEQWSQLVPQMLDAVGRPRLREIVETATRRVGRFQTVTDSPEGLVIVGHQRRALAWVVVDEHGELTNMLISARGPRRVVSRAARARLTAVSLCLSIVFIDIWAWTATTLPTCLGAVILLWFWLLLAEIDAPAAASRPWLRRELQIGAVVALPALARLPDLPFGDAAPFLPVALVGYGIWWTIVVRRARRHRWGLATSVPLQFPVRGRWYVADGGVPLRAERSRRGFVAEQVGTIDLLQVNWRGSRHGPAKNLESYLAYGQDVHSPCAGKVVAAVDGLIDQIPGAARFAPTDGNHVLIDTGAEVVRLAHLRAGSIVVDADDWVRAGQLIGEVGNSGRSSQPRLSIDAIRAGRKLDLDFTDIEGPLYSGRTIQA